MTAARSIADSRRPTLYGRRHAISSGHYLASAAGYAILEAGGNAIDAGCAAGIALGVLHANEVNVAGVAPIMIRTGAGELRDDRRSRSLAGELPRRPVHARARRRDPAGDPAHGRPRGARRMDHGAARLRDDGLRETSPPRRPAMRATGSRSTSTWPTTSPRTPTTTAAGRRALRSICPGGAPPQPGDRFVQSDLAATLQYMADEERAGARRGRVGGARGGPRGLLLRRDRRADRQLPRAARRLLLASRPGCASARATSLRSGSAGATSRS